jgi:hypothetical protein
MIFSSAASNALKLCKLGIATFTEFFENDLDYLLLPDKSNPDNPLYLINECKVFIILVTSKI